MTSKAIAIAAGGGGDVLTASILAARLRDRFEVVALTSYSWDRLIIDPTPGPRGFDDFSGLIRHHKLVAEVTASARLRGPGWSTLPPLVPYLAHPLLLMDPAGGAIDLAAQFSAAARAFAADVLVVIDVGGDILAEGHESGLRSPLADALTLAAALRTGLPVHLLVAGIGLDGELTPREISALLRRHGSIVVAELRDADISTVTEVWNWHPSEANGLLCAAVQGWRGKVETQRDALIDITDDAILAFEVDAAGVATHSLAADLIDTRSLEHSEQRIRTLRGYSDIDIERNRLAAYREPRMPTTIHALSEIDRYAQAASLRGVDALTLRRAIELTGAAGTDGGKALRDMLRRERPNNMRPPLYLV
ncbi:DUF1152 domain-containing protein [Nocardia brasiliensis]